MYLVDVEAVEPGEGAGGYLLNISVGKAAEEVFEMVRAAEEDFEMESRGSLRARA